MQIKKIAISAAIVAALAIAGCTKKEEAPAADAAAPAPAAAPADAAPAAAPADAAPAAPASAPASSN